MFNEPGGMPIAGGVALAGLLYAGVSAFVTGPVIGERMADKHVGWDRVCPAQIRAQIQADDPPAPSVPRLDLCGMLFGVYGSDGAAYCDMHGDHLNSPANQLIDRTNQQRQKAREWREDKAVSQAATRCECALTLTLERRRTDFALHAGSLRFVTPAPVRGLRTELATALNSPQCALKG